MKKQKRNKRLSLREQIARLRAANDRAEAHLKANPPLIIAKIWGDAFK
jgi:hypothetical protein